MSAMELLGVIETLRHGPATVLDRFGIFWGSGVFLGIELLRKQGAEIVWDRRSRQSSVRRLRSKLDLAYDFAVGLQQARTVPWCTCCVWKVSTPMSVARRSSIAGGAQSSTRWCGNCRETGRF